MGDGEKREKLSEDGGIDVLGDIIENSQDTPHGKLHFHSPVATFCVELF